MAHTINSPRFDAAESVFFKRELESIDKKVYDKKYPQLIARSLIPTISGVAPWQKVYTWREFDKKGSAKVIADFADDLPRVDVSGEEFSQLIKTIGDAYWYSIDEIQAAKGTGTPLDEMRAMAARYFIESKIDTILATGDAATGMKGLLNLASTTSFTPGTKLAGGLTWGTITAPNATGPEVAADIIGIVSKLNETTKGLWSKFRVLIPLEQYNYAAQVRMSTLSDQTALEFVMKVCPFIESITPWLKCDGAGSGGTDRMVAYPYDEMVLGALVPSEFEILPAQERNLAFVVNCKASCGGVVSRYPVAIAYGDGI
jgi:hypothetical protein